MHGQPPKSIRQHAVPECGQLPSENALKVSPIRSEKYRNHLH